MTIDKQALRISELEELNELLREKVKKLESDLWDKEQLRKVYSEKSFNLDSKVRELEARNQKDFVWRGNEISRLNDEVDELKEKLEAAERSMAEQSAIVAAAEKLVRCKGRYHSELNYRALAKLFGVITPDLPPLVHENVHYADAAEVEISALRQRIAELEARAVNLPKRSVDEVMHLSGFSRDYAEGWCAGNDNAIHEIRAAGIKVKES
ncbi:ead/Ea22-like family protein [Salmonella enterica]|uniref:ead/Ea22-like family protein n=1 Tax=Salmonella enterica TaxID=28901 RepID=UPI002119A674|nr:ead/Ea22-like family protein [Salmonella enterica]